MLRMIVSAVVLTLMAVPAWSQTKEIQDDVNAALRAARKAEQKEKEQKKTEPAKNEAPKPPTLEEMLTRAMKNHPDIRVAEAKVREAEAELDRAKLQVTQKVIAFNLKLDELREAVRNAERALNQYVTATKADPQKFPQESVGYYERILSEKKARLAEMEMELQFLIGKPNQVQNPFVIYPTAGLDFSNIHLNPSVRNWTDPVNIYPPFVPSNINQPFLPNHPVYGDPLQIWVRQQWQLNNFPYTLVGVTDTAKEPVKEAMAERIRKALDTPVKIDYKDKLLAEVLKDLEKQVPGVPFVPLRLSEKDKVTIQLSESVPLVAAIQAIEDAIGWTVHFGVRDYGIVAVGGGNAGMMSPRDLLTAHLRGKAEPKPLPADINGEVVSVDPNGLVKINIGSDAGLQKNHTLEVFRASPKPKYLGTVKIIEVTPKEAVGQPTKTPAKDSPMQTGDKVTGKFVSNTLRE